MIAAGPAKVEKTSLHEGVKRNLYPVLTAPSETAFRERVELAQRADHAARAYDPRIFQVQVTYADNLREVLVATSDGVLNFDRQPLARMSVFTLAREDNGVPQQGHAGGGGRYELSWFRNERTPGYFAREAARQAIVQLDAVEAPAGEQVVVLGPGWPGVLLHEAVGHGLEADFNRKGVSAFSGRIGQQVASPLCTVVDDGTIGGRRGSLNVDDEGNETQRNVLIENGILRGYLQDNLSSRILGARPTGSGRRESYEHIPMPRMTNTFMMAGESDPADDHSLRAARSLLRQLRRRPGRYHQRQFRLLGLRELSDRRRQADASRAQCHADRQRPGSDEIRQHGGERSEARRRHRRLR